jgi:hypothetical protein
LNSLVNCLRDNPMTQFSIHWILSLNRVSKMGTSPDRHSSLGTFCSNRGFRAAL